jgi:hypothetical protein
MIRGGRFGPRPRWSGARALCLACVVALLPFATLAPGSALAAGVSFGALEAHAVLGAPVTFRQEFRSSEDPVRVELVTSLPGEPGSDVQTADVTGSGSSRTASTEIDTHIRPNTTFRYRFRVILADGEAIEGPESTVTVVDDRFDWQIRTGTHVSIHWYDAGPGFGDRAAKVGDDAIDRAMALLGVTSVERVDYFVYADSGALYDAMGAGTTDNVGGQYYSPIRTAYADIAPYESNSQWASDVIAHELVHHVFDQATRNPYHEPPVWLNEGFAVYLAEGGPESRSAELKAAVGDGDVLPLEALAESFPRTSRLFSLAYAESVSAVAFLVERHGSAGLADLARRYRAGASDDEAFSGALGETAGAFGEAWLASIGAARATVLGPQPAPVGPLPSDWRLGAAASPVPANGGSAPPASAGALESGAPSAAPTGTIAPAGTAVPATADGGGARRSPGPWLLAVLAAALVGVVLVAVVVVEQRSHRRGAVGR